MTLTAAEQRAVDIQKHSVPTGSTFDFLPDPKEHYPPDMVFTPREMVGRYFRNAAGQRVLCAYVDADSNNGVPTTCFVPDFTQTELDDFVGLHGGNWDQNSIHWRNVEQNLPEMRLTLDLLPKAKVVYCVGSGPALMKNWRELLKVKGRPGHVIVGCNELLQYLPAGMLDYYTVLDACSPDRWWQGFNCSETTAIMGPIAPPSFRRANWKKVLWYRIGLTSPLNNLVKARKPYLKVLIPTFGAGPSELQIAWLMRPEVVVLVGHSYAYDMIDGVVYEHINEPLTEDRWEGVLSQIGEFATTDVHGKPVVTDYNIMITGATALAACQMLIDAGVRVVNATEGGVLKSNSSLPAYRNRAIFPEYARLAEVVEKLK